MLLREPQIKAWMKRVVWNTSINLWRERRGINLSYLDDTISADGQTLLSTIPDQMAAAPEWVLTRIELVEALSVLDQRERLILICNIIAGESQQEIGERFKLSQQRVSQLKAQALEKLRAYYEERSAS